MCKIGPVSWTQKCWITCRQESFWLASYRALSGTIFLHYVVKRQALDDWQSWIEHKLQNLPTSMFCALLSDHSIIHFCHHTCCTGKYILASIGTGLQRPLQLKGRQQLRQHTSTSRTATVEENNSRNIVETQTQMHTFYIVHTGKALARL